MCARSPAWPGSIPTKRRRRAVSVRPHRGVNSPLSKTEQAGVRAGGVRSNKADRKRVQQTHHLQGVLAKAKVKVKGGNRAVMDDLAAKTVVVIVVVTVAATVSKGVGKTTPRLIPTSSVPSRAAKWWPMT